MCLIPQSAIVQRKHQFYFLYPQNATPPSNVLGYRFYLIAEYLHDYRDEHQNINHLGLQVVRADSILQYVLQWHFQIRSHIVLQGR